MRTMKHCMRLAQTLFLLFMAVGSLFALPQQNRMVTGVVISSEDNYPVVGASVLVVGSSIGAVTNVDGKFSLSVPATARMLKVSFVGMVTKQVPIKSGTLQIVLDPDSKLLDEVMVVAYGTASKGSFTGSASVVSLDKIEDRPTTEVTSALLGATSGVTVQQATGEPGTASTVRIRGIGSFSASNDPLIILDGTPYDGALSSLNPSDIESITVLKDASSTALYGARAANGVLLINSKRGEEGKLRMSVKFNQGFTARQGDDYDRLNVKQYMETYWRLLYNKYTKSGMTNPGQTASEALKSSVGYNPFNVPADQMVLPDGTLNPEAQMVWADDADWEDAVLRLGKRTDANFSLSGGNKNTTYYASLGYTDEDGYVEGASFQRVSSKTSVTSQIKPWLKFNLSNSYTYSKTEGQMTTSRGSVTNTFRFLRYVPPICPIHLRDPETGEVITDENGVALYDFGSGYKGADKRVFGSGSLVNPAIELRDRDKGYERARNNLKGYVEVQLPWHLKFTVNGSYIESNYRYNTSTKSYPGKDVTGSVTKTHSTTSSLTFNELLSFQHNFGKHHLDLLVGHESYDYKYTYLTVSMLGEVTADNPEFTNYTSMNSMPNSYTRRYKTEGYLSRGSYDYDGRYFASFSFRRDGSSRFSKDARWGTFWSVGASWRIDQEPFLQQALWIDMLKLRASYGVVGNDDLGSYYPYQSTYESALNGEEAGFIIGNLGNDDLKWETSKNFDVALEFNFMKRYRGSIEFYNRVSGNLLFGVPLSPSSGSDEINRNAGSMYNRGFELNLGGDFIKNKKWKLAADLNLTYLKNKMTKVPVDAFIDNYVFRIEEGHGRYDYYLRQWCGVDPETGSSLYLPADVATAGNLVTVNGKEYTTSVEEAKYDYSGSGLPPVTGGLTLQASYRRIALQATLAFQLGGKMYDTAYYQLMYPNYNSSAQNLSTDILKAWNEPGDVTDVPRLSDDGNDQADLMGEYSTRWLKSSDELDLANVTLTYSCPKKWLRSVGLESAKIYVSGDNLLSFTAKKGLFPRFNEGGFDLNGDTYAPARAFTAGISISF